MRLPVSLLALLSVAPLSLVGCASDVDSDEEVVDQTLTKASADAGATADGGQQPEPPIVSPDDCPGCGMG